MRLSKTSAFGMACLLCALFSGPAAADEPPPPAEAQQPISILERYVAKVESGLDATLDKAIDLIGIRYRRGGTNPDTGFDCSGFVRHVFNEGLGLALPHSAKAMSKNGEAVARDELRPGDLVFFHTMRRTISHVGIYLGENRFIHAPASGGQVRVEDMNEHYWAKRFSGARRLEVN